MSLLFSWEKERDLFFVNKNSHSSSSESFQQRQAFSKFIELNKGLRHSSYSQASLQALREFSNQARRNSQEVALKTDCSCGQRDKVVARWLDSYWHTSLKTLEESSCNFLLITCNSLQSFLKFSPFNEKQDGDSAGEIFSNNEKVVSQCDDQTLGSTVEVLIIEFD